MEVKWIEHDGRKIVSVNFRGAKDGSEMINLLHQFAEILQRSPGRILSLLNFENAYVSPAFMNEAKKLGKEIGLEKMGKSAFVGVTGLKKILFQAYVSFTGQADVRTFDTDQEAKDWLMS